MRFGALSYTRSGACVAGLALMLGVFGASALACGGASAPKLGDPDDTPTDGDTTQTPSGDPGTNPDPGAFPSTETDAAAPVQDDECTKMDIVFVVDNSGSMGQEQDNLTLNFPKFGSIIDGYKTKSGNVLDYRLAVATTDAQNDKGKFVRKATTTGALPPWWPFPQPDSGKGCEAGPDRAWLERSDGKPVDYFACRARVGTQGSADENPLRNLLLGLTDRIKDGTNAANGSGFVRDDALLAFVVLTDEDESDEQPAIETYPPAFDAVKGGERGRWAAAVIAGETKCQSDQFGDAQEAKQLKKFIGDVGANGVFSSICEGDLTVGLTKALATFDKACKTFPKGPN